MIIERISNTYNGRQRQIGSRIRVYSKDIYIILLYLSAGFLNETFGSPIVYHLLTGILLLFAFKRSNKLLQWQIMLLYSLPLFALQSIAKLDFYPLFQISYYFISLIAFQRISRTLNFDYFKLPILYLVLAVIPIFILFCFVNIPVKMPGLLQIQEYSFYSRIVPNILNSFRVNIGPPNFTKHFSGELGLICSVASLFLVHYSKDRRWYLITGFSLYLLFFSGARTSLTTSLCCLLIYVVNKSKVRPRLSIIILSAFVIQFYGINHITDSILEIVPVDSFIGGLLRLDRVDQGITSGRDFLWDMHLTHFINNPILGAHSSSLQVTLGQELANGEVAQASSESVYTSKLAKYGVLGFLFPIVHICLFLHSLNRQMLPNIIWCTILILGNVYNSTYGNSYGSIQPLLYLLVFGNYSQHISSKNVSNSLVKK